MRRENRALAWALLVSLLFHGALLVAPPAFWETVEHATRTPPPITARLVEPPPPAPAPPAPPPPAPPPAPKPPPSPPEKAAPKPRVAPPPIPAQREVPLREQKPEQKEEPKKPEPDQPEPEEVRSQQARQPARSPETEPAPPAPRTGPEEVPPEKASPAPPVQAPEPDIPSLIGQYAGALKSEMRRQVKYPARARDEGWEGEGRLLLVVGEDGKVAQLSVVKSSGYALLDRALLEGARRAQARVDIPAGLRGRRFRFEIPFVMNLVDE